MKAQRAIRHGVDFFILVLILAIGLGGILHFNHQKNIQIAIVLVMSTFYVFWGIYHHHHDQSLHPKVVLEYIGIAILFSFLLSAFILRA